MTADDSQQIVEEIRISMQARSKAGRYYGSASIRERLQALDGVLFRDDGGTYYLRTWRNRPRRQEQRIVLLFEVEASTAHVITQTSDHYDWREFDHVQSRPFSMNVDGGSSTE